MAKKLLDLDGLKKYDEHVKSALKNKANKDELPKITHSIGEDTDKNSVPTVGATEQTYVRKNSAIDEVELLNLLD